MSEKTLKSSYSFRPRQDEAEEIKQFLMKQTNFGDAIRYLIEKEIMENGIRDMSKHIPAKRDIFIPGKKEIKVKSLKKTKDKENAPKNSIKVDVKTSEKVDIESIEVDKVIVDEVINDVNIANSNEIEVPKDQETEDEKVKCTFIDEAWKFTLGKNEESDIDTTEELQYKNNEIAASKEEIIDKSEDDNNNIEIPSCYL